MDFPASLYRHGSTFLWDGEMFDFIDVHNPEELEAALADGWVPHKPGKSEPVVAEPEAEEKPAEAPKPRRKGKNDH